VGKQNALAYEWGIAEIYAGLGDNDEAFAWLEKSYAKHFPDFVSIKYSPKFDNLRSDSRFTELLDRIGYQQ